MRYSSFFTLMAHVFALSLIVCLAPCGCDSTQLEPDSGMDGSDDAGIDDAGMDADGGHQADNGSDPGDSDQGADSGLDAGADSGTDAGADQGTDAGSDPGSDQGLDAGTDGGSDQGSDAGTDAGADQGGDEAPIIGLAYPQRDAYHIKGIQPDFWPDKMELVNHVTGGIAVNLVWDLWEPSRDMAPCNGSQVEYEGHCFNIRQEIDSTIKEYTDLGVVVTGIVYGVPAWARVQNTGCSPYSPAFERFCTPDDPADFARFAGMVARRYDGLHGHGRVADFVIHNEVNSNIWFDIGCGQGVPCDPETWIRTYAQNYAAAYDEIKSHQSEAKVLMSFEHHFDTDFDQPDAEWPSLSVKTMILGIAPQLGDRQWMIAYHPYPPDMLKPEFSPLDLPRVTYGNLGVLLGWLRATFPNDPHAWQVELTESGINSSSPSSSEAAQAEWVCNSFINVLGTPGVTNYIYHRMRDNSEEGQLQVGLIDSNGNYKQAWQIWALCNHIYDDPPQLSCGFEDLPYVRLRRSVKNFVVGSRHWASTRLAPDDFTEEASWLLFREQQPGTSLLFECLARDWAYGPHTFLSFDVGCEGTQIMGPVGYIYDEQQPDTVPLYRCIIQSGLDHFVSQSPDCEGQSTEQLLGYAQPG